MVRVNAFTMLWIPFFVCSYINERNRKRNIVEAEKAAAVCISFLLYVLSLIQWNKFLLWRIVK